ncbi:MAG: DNA polymerase III subunit delta [Holophagaceae bacterium]|uniref:DNA-directed DNA polymerase n=1 Tax=Candidatus Geothrix skivensis TaxID=2954439 RepID=A0A9D7SF52_9BACT|nr:DNA polymerase III subunit delta [Candidatus Geothrix skivensis]
MASPAPWLNHAFALVHGEDGDGRREAVEAWKRKHVDPEWADFSLTLCSEGCPWPEVLAALQEASPLGAEARSVVVPAADNLFTRAKELPAAVKAVLEKPPSGVNLLLVAWSTLPAAPGKALGAKPWTDWQKAGRILKVGALDAAEVPGFIEAEARARGLILQGASAGLLAQRQGGNPGLLKRALEVLDLLAEDRRVTEAMVDQVTFRLAEQKAFAWSGAWQKGDAAGALRALRMAMEDGDEPLMMLGQVRREVDRLLRLAEAEAAGLKGAEVLGTLGLSPKQAFLLDGYRGALAKLKPRGLKALLSRVNQCERDLKGMALSRSEAPLLDLTLALCRAWGR